MKVYNLFISHSWNYSDRYEGLLNLLEQCDVFFYKDYSVPRDAPIHNTGSDIELLAAIREQMEPCDVVLVLAGVDASYSRWIQIEVNLAYSGFRPSFKPVIAVEPRGSERTSEFVKEKADEVVKWNTKSIVDAIEDWGDLKFHD